MKNLTFKIVMIFAIMAMAGSAYAQTRQVTGTVKDSAGDPIIGAAVSVEGTSIGVSSNIDGSFVINVPQQSATLVVSFLGYQTQHVAVGGGKTVYDIVLLDDTQNIDEIVVVGYGTQKKSVVSASISSITAENLKTQSNTRIDNLLQGMTSGVTVTQNSGAPDASSQVRIRGVGSIHGSDPLYIVDGLAISGGIDYLNPNDI